MDDNGVTPVIGTILILAVTVAGIGVTLLLGAPVIQRLQDQSALENMAAQFAEVRAEAGRLTAGGGSVAPGLNLAGGKAVITEGTDFVITIHRDGGRPLCDLRFFDWANEDNILTWFSTPGTCRTIGVDNPATGCDAGEIPGNAPLVGCAALGLDPLLFVECRLAGGSCIEAYRLPDGSNNLVPAPQSLCPVFLCVNSVQLQRDIAAGEEWLFRLTDGAGTVYLDAWLLHTDRLEWGRGGVRAVYEGGALFVQGAGATHLEGTPDIQEGRAEDSNPGPPDPVRVNLPIWQESAGATLTGSGLHALRMTYQNGQALAFNITAYRLRYDFHGDLAGAWCNSLLMRNSNPIIAGDPYVVEPIVDIPILDSGHQCNPVTPNPDGIRGVVYDPYDPDLLGPDTFPVTLSRQVLHARLEP